MTDMVNFSIKIPKAMYEKIKEVVERGDYISMAEFIRKAVKELLKEELEKGDDG